MGQVVLGAGCSAIVVVAELLVAASWWCECWKNWGGREEDAFRFGL